MSSSTFTIEDLKQLRSENELPLSEEDWDMVFDEFPSSSEWTAIQNESGPKRALVITGFALRNVKMKIEEQAMQLEDQAMQLEVKDTKIEEQAMQLEVKDTKIEEQAMQIEQASLRAVLQRKENFLVRKRLGTKSKSHVDQKREGASIKQIEFRLQEIGEFQDQDRRSRLSGMFEEGSETYSNEADLQVLVHLGLKDAVAIVNSLLGDKGRLSVRRESGLFSNNPDHDVVLDKVSGNPVLSVETKQPIETIHRKVWGQVYDYIEYMRLLGHPNPFAVLTTFKQSWLAWKSSDLTCENLVNNIDRLLGIGGLNELSEKIRAHENPQLVTSSPSPALREESSQGGDNIQTDDNYHNRELAISQSFESAKLVALFVHAIVCSLQNLSGKPTLPSLTHDQNYRRPVLTLGHKGYEFQTIDITILKYDEKAIMKAKKFHIVTLLGQGRTSKAYRAIASTGHECVIKMYVRRFDETNNYTRMSKQIFDKNAKASMQQEKNNYERIYRLKVRRIVLNGFQCLVLPFFAPIAPEDRAGSREDIRSVLIEKFVRQSRLVRFKDSDICWRHCGKDTNGKLVIFDLAELEELSDPEEYVKHHLETLFNRLGATAADSVETPSG